MIISVSVTQKVTNRFNNRAISEFIQEIEDFLQNIVKIYVDN